MGSAVDLVESLVFHTHLEESINPVAKRLDCVTSKVCCRKFSILRGGHVSDGAPKMGVKGGEHATLGLS